MNKGSTGTDSDGDSYGQLLKFHLIGTDIGAKLGTVAIGIGIGITIGIRIGSVETILHIIIEPNFIGIGIGIGVGQWKHTITASYMTTETSVISVVLSLIKVRLKLFWVIFTAHKRSCEKVMFSQVSVCPQDWGWRFGWEHALDMASATYGYSVASGRYASYWNAFL